MDDAVSSRARGAGVSEGQFSASWISKPPSAMQQALDWAMSFYPFADGLNPPPEIRAELEASLARNRERLTPGWRR
jgi:hypothetical protein